jgi:hypothetical protein
MCFRHHSITRYDVEMKSEGGHPQTRDDDDGRRPGTAFRRGLSGKVEYGLDHESD